MSKFARCIIHVGTEKTGTTSIQESLSLNRKILAKKGFLFPSSFGEKNHVKLAVCASREERKIPFFERVVLSNGGNKEKFESECLSKFAREVKGSKCNTLLISNEHLHGQLHSLDSKKRLRSIFEGLCDRIQVVIYLRRQDSLAVSLFTTRLLAGDTDCENILPKKIDARNLRFDYYRSISDYVEVFGRENIVVRLYDKKSFFDQELISDFYHVIGLEDVSQLVPVPKENTSLNSLAQEYLALFNREVPKFIDGKLNPAYGDIQAILRRNFSGRGRLPSRESAFHFFSLFQAGNERIRELFFPERKTLFEEDFSNYPEESTPFASKEELVRVSSMIWEAQNQG